MKDFKTESTVVSIQAMFEYMPSRIRRKLLRFQIHSKENKSNTEVTKSAVVYNYNQNIGATNIKDQLYLLE
jgi:hypothetical protein